MPEQTASVRPASDRRALSTVAYGFIASKALFAALELDLFTVLAAGQRTPDALAPRTGVAEKDAHAAARTRSTRPRRPTGWQVHQRSRLRSGEMVQLAAA